MKRRIPSNFNYVWKKKMDEATREDLIKELDRQSEIAGWAVIGVFIALVIGVIIGGFAYEQTHKNGISDYESLSVELAEDVCQTRFGETMGKVERIDATNEVLIWCETQYIKIGGKYVDTYNR